MKPGSSGKSDKNDENDEKIEIFQNLQGTFPKTREGLGAANTNSNLIFSTSFNSENGNWMGT